MKSTVHRSAKKARLISADDVLAKAGANPRYGEAFEDQREEFELIAAMIKARSEAGLTQAQVAERMSTTQAVVARLEAGGRRPSTRTLERFATATGTKLKISFEPKRKGGTAAR
ncbi:MAG: helix-turn-helix domain-containing protein [Hyphomicrobium sp.]